MRYKDWGEFSKRYPEEAEWIEANRATVAFAADMHSMITSKRDVTPRQRKAMRRAVKDGTIPEEGTVPAVGDILCDETVSVFGAYTVDGQVRYTFRHPDGYAGRWSLRDMSEGRSELKGYAIAAGHKPFGAKPDSTRRTFSFEVKVISAKVVWRRKDFVILEDVEIDRGHAIAEAARRAPSGTPPTLLDLLKKKFDDSADALAHSTDPFGFSEDEEPEPPEEEIAHTTDRGVPLPDFADWKERLK